MSFYLHKNTFEAGTVSRDGLGVLPCALRRDQHMAVRVVARSYSAGTVLGPAGWPVPGGSPTPVKQGLWDRAEHRDITGWCTQTSAGR